MDRGRCGLGLYDPHWMGLFSYHPSLYFLQYLPHHVRNQRHCSPHPQAREV
ncbi:unnamed protein product [Penicillium olsonii]|uniref:Uncharacterized protein n=1 Tax=Penicillium olsonii TaxID=99116 RepID=A0A9W4I9R3_PENOL|nr:unnamed protein product [Penicillium olsonii]CAG8159218.1 unnamed protein product [Penicillium olsonii]CAG8242255.1 unnamed protein product [Penicillium olsonii]